MKTNVGTIDRLVRAVLGLAFLSLILILEGNAWWLGLLPLATALPGWCPAYV